MGRYGYDLGPEVFYAMRGIYEPIRINIQNKYNVTFERESFLLELDSLPMREKTSEYSCPRP